MYTENIKYNVLMGRHGINKISNKIKTVFVLNNVDLKTNKRILFNNYLDAFLLKAKM